MEKKERKPKGYWDSYENCYNAAKECRSRTEFGKKHTNAYANSLKNGWLDEFFPKKVA